MDINMPGMDGVETTAKIRKLMDPYIKKRGQLDFMIVAHTALPEDQFGDYKEKGFDGFMEKPIDNGLLQRYL
jgi:two-component system sensor histidine kinase BarA